MSYFNELTEENQNEIKDVLTQKLTGNCNLTKEAQEITYNWINTHNGDFTNADWLKSAEDADI